MSHVTHHRGDEVGPSGQRPPSEAASSFTFTHKGNACGADQLWCRLATPATLPAKQVRPLQPRRNRNPRSASRPLNDGCLRATVACRPVVPTPWEGSGAYLAFLGLGLSANLLSPPPRHALDPTATAVSRRTSNTLAVTWQTKGWLSKGCCQSVIWP